MTAKTVVKTLLLSFVAVSLTTFTVQELRSRSVPVNASPVAEDKAGATQEPAVSENKVIAYYFHTTVRCPTCRKIEALAKETVETTFAEELKSGALAWRVVNVQLPENRHFTGEYQLFTKSVVIVKIENGKRTAWKNLERVWDLTDDKAAYMSYVGAEIKKYLARG